MKVRLTLILIFVIDFCMAQPGTVGTVRQSIISLNSGHNQFKDRNLHPKVFRGLNVGIDFTHAIIRQNIISGKY